MFTTGQWIFAVLFTIAFAIAIWFTYRSDRQLHAKNYKGVKWIVLGFAIFIIILFILKYALKP